MKETHVNLRLISDFLSECELPGKFGSFYLASGCKIAYSGVKAAGASTPALRKEQIALLERAFVQKEENCGLVWLVVENR